MSLSYSVHIGPYVRCKVKMGEREVESYYACNVATCSQYGKRVMYGADTKYCMTCGKPLGPFPRVMEIEVVDDDKVRQATRDALEPQHRNLGDCRIRGLHIWTPNVRRKGDPSFSFDPKEGEQFVDLVERDYAAGIESFSVAFATELAIMREMYGAENVEVRWGVLNTIS